MAIIDKPSDYFETKLYTGNGGTQSITGLDFQPDWVWIKQRNEVQNHRLVDSVRGKTKEIFSDLTTAEQTLSNGITAFNSNGFGLGSSNGYNKNSGTYASWNWKAGTSFTNDASSTGIGTIDSTGSFNNDSGFSIVSYTGTGSNGTIKHGLNSAPSCIITKSASAAEDWGMYHVGIGNTSNISLNLTNAKYSANSAFWNNTNPTSSVFTVGTHPTINYNTKTMIAYCFAEKQGFSKIGSYTGNGNADGTFIYTGFKPAYVMLKRTDTAGERWNIKDNKRDGYNQTDPVLTADASGAEYDDSQMDLLSNGFKIRTSAVSTNASGGTYIFMAFAENPFVASNFNAATAR